MGHKAAKITHNINTFDPGIWLIMNIQCSGASRSFARDESFEDGGAQWSAIGKWQGPIERIIKADPLKTTESFAEELDVDHSAVEANWKDEKTW